MRFSYLGGVNFNGEESFYLSPKNAAQLYGISFYDGVFGPGSGTLSLYFYARQKVSYLRAIGLSRIMIFSSYFGASISFIATDKILWPLTIALMIGSLSGAQLGVRLASKIKKEHVAPILRIVTLLLMLQILLKYFG